MPGVHALLGASKSKQWLACPPSARLNAQLSEHLGEGSSIFAEEGTKAHNLSELKLRYATKEINKFLYETELSALGEIEPEMDKATDFYVDVVMQKYYEAKKKCPDAKIMIEQHLDYTQWVPEGFGTGDAVIVSDSGLEVCDLKYGKGVPVSAIGNSQARLYGLGALALYGELYSFTHIRNTIIQPRLDSVTEETLTREELLDWAEKIRPIAALAYKGQGEFKAGDHCKFCNASPICRARALESMKAFEYGFDSPDILDDDSIPKILEVADMAKSWLSDLQDYARVKAIKGHEWPGFKLVHGRRPPRSFADEEEAKVLLARAGLENDVYMTAPKMKSVAEVEKALGKSTFNALLGEQVVQADGALTLVPEDDKREGISSADAVFADL